MCQLTKARLRWHCSCNSCTHLSAFRTEWTIYEESEQLAGSIDFVAMDGEGHLVLFDWKRSKDLRTKYCNKFQRMRRAFASPR